MVRHKFHLTAFTGLLAAACLYLGACTGNGSRTGCPPEQVAQDTTLSAGFELDSIHLPPGFRISVYALIPDARSLCVSPSGTVFVGTRGDKVYAITDENHDGKADKIYRLASGLDAPNGVAFRNGSLYIATISTIFRLDSIESRLEHPPSPVVVYDRYPTDRHHGYKFIAFGPDGDLYVPVGAPCNICEPGPPYASLTRIRPDGTGFEIFATGIRNTVGFDWNPIDGQLWFTDNGRDNLGDDIPSDELNNAPRPGMNFGYPYCHQGDIPDPEFGKGKDCRDFTPPVKKLGAHVASLGMRFYRGSGFPPEFRNALFIAEHGSWNRTVPVGYRVVVARQDDSGHLADPVPFATGWLRDGDHVSGRPVDVQPLPDGSLLISDDYRGAIYRVTYSK